MYNEEEHKAWLREPAAEEFRKDLRADLSAARDALEGAADKSQDPNVRAAYERWRALEELVRRLSA